MRLMLEAMLNGATPHVDQAGQCRGGVVGVQRRQHQVLGVRCLNRNVGCLQITDLADHDDVRVLAQERAQRGCKGQAAFLVDVDLVDAGQVDFGRILGGGDVHTGLIEDVEAGVQRHRLARPRGAGDEHHTVRATDRLQ